MDRAVALLDGVRVEAGEVGGEEEGERNEEQATMPGLADDDEGDSEEDVLKSRPDTVLISTSITL